MRNIKNALRSGLAVALVSMVAACGGGGNDGGAAPATDANQQGGNSNQTLSFFDGVFLKDKGAGFYQFAVKDPFSASALNAECELQYYVDTSADLSLSMQATSVSGTCQAPFENALFITQEGAFTSMGWRATPLGAGMKLFQKLPSGFELGPIGSSVALYRIDMTVTDVSDQAVDDVIHNDEGILEQGLNQLFTGDRSAMPKGSQQYQAPYTVLATHVRTDLQGRKANWQTLEAAQAASGGTIQSLGGYRYLTTPGNVTYVEYNGAIYYGGVLQAGDVENAEPAAYNETAATYLRERAKANAQ